MNFTKIRELWAALSIRQRVQIGVALGTTLALVWGFTLYANRIRYGVLFSNYRGSTGRGLEFAASAYGDPAGAEFDDIVAEARRQARDVGMKRADVTAAIEAVRSDR